MSKLTEVLAAHRPLKDPGDDQVWCASADGTVWVQRLAKWVRHRETHGFFDSIDAWAEHVEQAIASAGLAVVELPEPDVVDTDEYAYWGSHTSYKYVIGQDIIITAHPGDGVIYHEACGELTSEEAQGLAASLLAAAKLAGPNRLEAPR